MKSIVDQKLYNTETAQMLANDRFWDGHNFERSGRNTYLYKTKKGAYFAHHTTCWTGEMDQIQALDKLEAKKMYEELAEKKLEWEQAFDEAIEEA